MNRALLLLARASLVSLASFWSLTSLASDPAATLRWTNGESITGDLVEATGTTATWKAPFFEQPVALAWDVIHRVDWPPAAAATTGSDPFLISLRDGSSIHGDLLGISGSSVFIQGSRFGPVELKRTEVLAARRIKGDALVLAGPSGPAGWWELGKSEDGSILEGASHPYSNLRVMDPGVAQPGGVLELPYWNTAARLDVQLPDAVDIEFRVHASSPLDFQLCLGDQPEKFLQIDTWGDEIVVAEGGGFKLIRKLAAGEHEIALRLCWDRATAHCAVYTPAGDLVADWYPKDKEPPPVPGLFLRNKGRDLSLDFLRIRKWDGNPPPKADPSRPRVELADGRILAGEVTSGSAGSVLLSGSGEAPETTLALKDVDALVFSPDPPASTAAPAILSYADGTYLKGRIAGIKDGGVTLVTSFAAQPVTASMASLRQLLIAPAPVAAPAKPLAKMDRLIIQKTTFHGTLVAGGGAGPGWLPVGAVSPVTLSKAIQYEITRSLPDNASNSGAAALFYTRMGDVLPGAIHALDRTGVDFDSSLTKATKLPAAALEAIQFGATGRLGMHGFTDPAWSILKGDKSKVRISGDSLEMDAGTAIGNAAAMQSSEIRFTMKIGRSLSMMRLRMFCAGVDSSKATNFVFVTSANEVECGIEGTPGQFDNTEIEAAPASGTLAVRLAILEDEVDLYLNGLCVEKFPVPASDRPGTGLIIEPTVMWGNSPVAIKLSDFAMASSPGCTWLPNVAADAKAEALTVPRSRHDDPPTHALIAANGDILRGEIEGATNANFGFRSGLEELIVPRDRVKAIIWLGKPQEAAPAAAAKAPALQLLDQRLNLRANFSRANLGTVTSYLQIQAPGLKFKLPEKGGEQLTSFRMGMEPVSAALDRICAYYGLAYRVDDSGVIVIEAKPDLPPPMVTKLYWLKPGSLPGNAPADKILAGKGVAFPPGATAVWNADSGQLQVQNTDENQARVAQVLASDFGGSIGSPTHWLVLTSGARLGLVVDGFGPDTITGWHPLYGRCVIPEAEVAVVRSYPLEPSAAMKSIADWHLVYAPEPVLPDAGGESSASIGKAATDFKLALLAGGQFQLAQEKGKVVVLDFWATWCGPCVRSLPELIEAMSHFSTDRVKFIGVNEDEPAAQVKQFLETRGWNLSVALDDGRRVGQQYGVDGIPHTVIVGADGKVAWVNTGYSPGEGDEVAKEVNQLIAGPPTSAAR